MKKILLLFSILLFTSGLHAQNVSLKADSVSAWVTNAQGLTTQNAFGTFYVQWGNAAIGDSTAAFVRNDGTIIQGSKKYSFYVVNGTPFASMAAMAAWVKQYFFVDASANGGGGLDASLYSGWAAYQDTIFTQASPFHLVSGSKKTLPNRAQMTIETQKPIDVNMFYNKADSTITGRAGDGLNVYVEFVAVPDASTTYLQSTIDIGGVVGELFNSVYTFPNGAGVPQRISYSFAGYTLDTWQANGAKVKVMSDGNCDIYGIRYVLTRTHKAR